MKNIILSFLLFTPSLLLATPNGIWSGQGKITEPDKVTPCQEVFVKLLEDEKNFYLTNAGYSCNQLHAEYPYSIFKKSNGELIFQNTVVGYYDDQTFFIEKPDEGFQLLLKKYENRLIFTESWIFSDDFFIVSGALDLLKN